MIMIVISFALVKFYAFAILYVLIVMQIKLVVVRYQSVQERSAWRMVGFLTDKLVPLHSGMQ